LKKSLQGKRTRKSLKLCRVKVPMKIQYLTQGKEKSNCGWRNLTCALTAQLRVGRSKRRIYLAFSVGSCKDTAKENENKQDL